MSLFWTRPERGRVEQGYIKVKRETAPARHFRRIQGRSAVFGMLLLAESAGCPTSRGDTRSERPCGRDASHATACWVLHVNSKDTNASGAQGRSQRKVVTLAATSHSIRASPSTQPIPCRGSCSPRSAIAAPFFHRPSLRALCRRSAIGSCQHPSAFPRVCRARLIFLLQRLLSILR